MRMRTPARDVERAFRAWLALARDEEVLALADLVQHALEARGFLARVSWFKKCGARNTEAGMTHGEDEQSQERSQA